MENILQSHIPSSRVHIHSAMFFINWIKIYNNNSIFSSTSFASYAFRYLPTYQTLVWYIGYPLLEWQPFFYRKGKMCSSQQGCYCSLTTIRITFHPITFHPILGKITFTSIHVSPNSMFHPNYVSPKLYLLKSFTQFFFLLKHTLLMSYDFWS